MALSELKGFSNFVAESGYEPDGDFDRLNYVVVIKKEDTKTYLMVSREEAFLLKKILDNNGVDYAIGIRPDPLLGKKEQYDED